MAKYTFKSDLSVKGIENLQKELLNYKNNILQRKVDLLVKELAKLGAKVAKAKIEESPLGKYVTLTVDVSPEEAGCKAILLAVGEVKQSDEYSDFNTLLAIEFGAGIYYNPEENPNSDKLGFGVGTFPGQLHAFESGWWYWDDESVEWRYTHGVKATMPMYNAHMEMTNEYVKLAKKIFGK